MTHKTQLLITYLVVFVATLTPRLLLIGAPPATDEGIYAFNALMVHAYAMQHTVLPDLGSLSAYPTLLSWVFSTAINPFISLRFLDAIVASCTGLLLYLVIAQESQDKTFAFSLTLIAIITYNDPVFIQYGFKNSIHAALLPLLAAIWMARRNLDSPFKWQYVGALMALAVLLREPFISFAVIGSVIVWIYAGRQASIAYISGGIVTGFLGLSVFMMLRGGYSTLLGSYITLGQMYEAIAYQQPLLSHSSVISFLGNSAAIILLAVISASVVMTNAIRQPDLLKTAAFWILVAITPLLEPMLKNGYPYHYAVSLIGLSGLIAYGYRIYTRHLNICAWLWPLAIAIGVVLVAPKLIKLHHLSTQYPPGGLMVKKHFFWPDKTVSQSNYLMIAQKIKQLSAHESTTMAINGSMLGLIPLAHTLPSHYSLSHLSYALLAEQNHSAGLKDKINQCPPEFIVLTTSSPFNDALKLNAIVKSIPEYTQVAYISKSEARHYGQFDGLIYRWNAPLKPCRLISSHE